MQGKEYSTIDRCEAGNHRGPQRNFTPKRVGRKWEKMDSKGCSSSVHRTLLLAYLILRRLPVIQQRD